MRPTLLGFRSPKERTPVFLNPIRTYDGRKIYFNSPKGSGKSSTFGHEKRFLWYKKYTQGGGFMVGPGSYTPMCLRNGKERISSIAPYKKLFVSRENSSNEFTMIGDLIVYDVNTEIFGHSRPGAVSHNKISTKNSTSEFNSYSDKKRWLTPEPLQKINISRKKVKKNKTVNRKVFNIEKVNKLIKNRFDFC